MTTSLDGKSNILSRYFICEIPCHVIVNIARGMRCNNLDNRMANITKRLKVNTGRNIWLAKLLPEYILFAKVLCHLFSFVEHFSCFPDDLKTGKNHE